MRTITQKTRTVASALAIGALTLSLGACGAKNSNDEVAGDDGDNYAEQYADCTPGEGAQDLSTLDPDGDKKLTVAAFNGWDESFAAAHLYKYMLEQDGYSVDIQSLDAGPGYTGLSSGDIDVLMDSWLPLTHVDYINQYHDDIEAHGCWYDSAKLTIAVNEDSPAQSIADLKDVGDDYGKRLVGIEPGAGETTVVKETMIPTYGLDDWNFQTSSTPAMLAELKKATSSGDDIAVTLWRPHWAYDAFPVRDLEDPEGAMGEAENILNFSRTGFGDDNPYAAQLLQNFVMDDEHLSSLENLMFSDDNYGGENLDAAVKEWAKDNADFIEDWKAGALGQ
ncbi:glycine betaine ABC transporter substrate-binding protein [Corynebacterium variabile]|uniref:glycine betaine ABC transporter substrate-binding protein n=1 Tax=Corynebacterium variabile TaxID=1727 RepID=UPI0028A89A3A|nr:glycine betaine ABC transporter substrate-binding protein [Corynebacterium variabile]